MERWYRGPVRRASTIAALTIMVLAALPAAASAGAPQDPFLGSYRSVDLDGSDQFLAMGGSDDFRDLGAIRAVIIRDDAGSVCGGARAFVDGFGKIFGDTIYVFVEVSCGNSHEKLGDSESWFTVGPGPDQLTDTYGVVWTRH